MRWRPTARRLAVLGVVVLGATLVQAGGQASADPPPEAVPVRAGLTQVTLITGDVVAFDPRPDGKDQGILVKQRPGVRYQVLSGPTGLFVLPSDALPLISANTVDRDLFNVSYLARNGYGDEPDLPVIIKGALPASTSSLAAPASRALPSIGATSTRIAKARTGEFWQSVAPASGSRSRALASGVTKVLLDRRVRATLAESVAQIHAPEAWAAGADGKGVRVAVLDTGIDATHPDLAGKVVDSRSFVRTEPDVVDHNGHGTHVASTIAGSGAASGGRERGVAPGVDLVIGKVLGRGGLGNDSDVVAGMEWAAKTAHARVISMSLGSLQGQGEDVQSEAVRELTASTGALFVAAAGNSGPNRATLTSPAIAPEALAVGAVDNTDQTAPFSSRGPGPDGSVKPEIMAPGVQILAARAAGTEPTLPASQRYIAMSGTSMATPHVAGAAAVLAQRHPDWTANTLKSALVSSSKDLGRSPVEQGTGRADVFAALSQTTTARPAALTFGALPAPQTGTQNQTVTYHNDGTAPVTLAVDAKLADLNGTPVPAGTLTTAAQVTVPAGGDATLPVALTPGKVGAGGYQGMITAKSADGRVRVVTPVGFSNGPVAHRTTVQVLGYDGNVRKLLGQDLWYLPLDIPNPSWEQLDFSAGKRDLLLARGRYLMIMFVHGEDTSATEMTTIMVKPDVAVTADSTQTFDMRDARPVRVNAPEPVLPQGTDVLLRRATYNGDEYRIFTHVGQDDRSLLYLDTGPPVPGFSFDYLTALTRSQLDVTVGSVTVHPWYISPDGGENPAFPVPVKMFDGRQRVGVVYVGEGGDAGFAGKDVRGKLVLTQRATVQGGAADVVERANAGGAVGVVVFDSAHYTRKGFDDGYDILPVTYLRRTDGLRLLDEVTRGHTEAELLGTPVSPFSYHLIDNRRATMPPEGLTLTVDPRKMVRYDTTYHAPAGASINSAMTLTDGQPLPDGDFLRAPNHRVDYYGPVKPGAVLQRFVIKQQIGDDFLYLAAPPEPMDRPANRSDSWNVTPRRPGQSTFEAIAQPQSLMLSRTGDAVYFTPQVVDGRGHRDIGAPNFDEMSARLTRDGVNLPGTPGPKSVVYPVPKGPGRYAYEVYYTPKVMAPDGYRTETRWEFGSAAPTKPWPASPYSCGDAYEPAAPDTPCAALPALMLDYQWATSPTETMAAPGIAAITVGARQTPGVTGARVDRIAAETSYDGGKSWQRLWLLPAPDGRRMAFVPHWQAGSTVSFRLAATDTAGNKVTQTILNAYRLVGH